jgi:arylsulfatase A-like enzyme
MRSILLSTTIAFAAAADAARPNVVVILADDLGYGDLGCYGARDIPTPHLDRLAAAGLRCTDGYVSAPQCSPSRAGLLTGRWQNRFGHEYNYPKSDATVGLPPSQRTLAQRLRAAGYAAGIVGKWHLGHGAAFTPAQHGFTYMAGFLSGGHDYLRSRADAPAWDYLTPLTVQGRPQPWQGYLTQQLGDWSAAWIRQQQAGKPFFLYASFNAPHGPFQATPELLARVAHIPEDPRPAPGKRDKGSRRTLAAMIVSLDDAVGQILHALDERQLSQDTLVVFLSDNGSPLTGSNGTLRGLKGDLHEGGIRVPFILRWPGRIPAGGTSATPVTALDLAPTICAAAGVPIAADQTDGQDLLPHWSGGAAPAERTLRWRFRFRTHLGALRQGAWKYVRIAPAEGGPAQESLFRLPDDPGEQRDLATTEADRLAALRKAWLAWDATLAAPAWPMNSE